MSNVRQLVLLLVPTKSLFINCACSVLTLLHPDLFSQVKNVPRLAEESRAQGTVPASLYVKYLTAGTGVIWITVVLVMGVCVEVKLYF